MLAPVAPTFHSKTPTMHYSLAKVLHIYEYRWCLLCLIHHYSLLHLIQHVYTLTLACLRPPAASTYYHIPFFPFQNILRLLGRYYKPLLFVSGWLAGCCKELVYHHLYKLKLSLIKKNTWLCFPLASTLCASVCSSRPDKYTLMLARTCTRCTQATLAVSLPECASKCRVPELRHRLARHRVRARHRDKAQAPAAQVLLGVTAGLGFLGALVHSEVKQMLSAYAAMDRGIIKHWWKVLKETGKQQVDTTFCWRCCKGITFFK